MLHALLIPLVFAAGDGSNDALKLKARITSSKLVVGKTYEIDLICKFDRGWSGDEAGLPHPILHVNVPPSAELAGDVLATQKELSKNEFLHAPYERQLEDKRTKIEFTLLSEPHADEVFSLTVIAYAQDKAGENYFLRERVEVPLQPRGKSRKVAAVPSNFGGDFDYLQIGDKAVEFDLPKADGSHVKLADYIGKKNIVVTTYRAFW